MDNYNRNVFRCSKETYSEKSMKLLAKSISNYLSLFEDIMISPDELKNSKKDVQEAKKIIKKLIKKLTNGDKSVFRDE